MATAELEPAPGPDPGSGGLALLPDSPLRWGWDGSSANAANTPPAESDPGLPPGPAAGPVPPPDPAELAMAIRAPRSVCNVGAAVFLAWGDRGQQVGPGVKS